MTDAFFYIFFEVFFIFFFKVSGKTHHDFFDQRRADTKIRYFVAYGKPRGRVHGGDPTSSKKSSPDAPNNNKKQHF